jgi:hypothetical protein
MAEHEHEHEQEQEYYDFRAEAGKPLTPEDELATPTAFIPNLET